MSLFRELFGPPLRECWQAFSESAGGRYQETGFWGRPRVVFPHGRFVIALELYDEPHGRHSTRYTRFRAVYRDLDGLRFKIYRPGFFTELALWLGAQNLDVGHPDFDRQFILKGNDSADLTHLFDDQRLRELLALQQEPRLEACRDEFWFQATLPDGEAELRYLERGVIKDRLTLQQILDLMKACLDRLCEIGSARAPDTKKC